MSAWTLAMAGLLSSGAINAVAAESPGKSPGKAEPPPRAVSSDRTPAENLPCHRVVFRISDQVLNSLMDQRQIDREVDVDDVILGTTVRGKAHIVGNTFVQPNASPEQALFTIHFRGVVVSRTVGHNGPAILHNVATTHFTATKQVVFTPGQGFRGLEPSVVAKTECRLEGVDSTRQGLIGRMVRRRAELAAEERRPQATEIARQRAEQRILAAFETSSEERLAKLNQRADFKSLAVAVTGAGQGEAQYVCCTTPRYIQIATRASNSGEANAPEAIKLPVHDSPHTPSGAPIEIWVHESLMKNRVMAGLELLGEKVRTSDFALATTAALKLLGASNDTVTAQPIRVRNWKDWRVVEIETLPVDKLSAPAVVAPAPAVTARSAPPAVVARSAPAAVKVLKPVFPEPAKSVAPSEPRTWTSGKYTAEASFVALEGTTVRLKRTNGVGTRIELAKLSELDQQWIRDHLASK
jgi:hypothetical protein